MPTQAIERRSVLHEEVEDHSTSAKSSVSSISRDVANHLVRKNVPVVNISVNVCIVRQSISLTTVRYLTN